jgi:hypothetical protein
MKMKDSTKNIMIAILSVGFLCVGYAALLNHLKVREMRSGFIRAVREEGTVVQFIHYQNTGDIEVHCQFSWGRVKAFADPNFVKSVNRTIINYEKGRQNN